MFNIRNIQGKVLYSSKDYKDFKGERFKDFVQFIINNKGYFYEADFEGQDLSCMNFNNIELSHALFKSCDLSFTTFDNCSVYRTRFTMSKLYHVIFAKADMTETLFNIADLESVKFIDCLESSYDYWRVSYIAPNRVIIGCKTKTFQQWDLFFSKKTKQEYTHKRDSHTFKRIKASYESMKAYRKTLQPELFEYEYSFLQKLTKQLLDFWRA